MQGLADESFGKCVEVVGREGRDPRYVFECEWLGEVSHDVVDGAVDPVDVVEWRTIESRKIWQVAHAGVTVQSRT